MFAATDAVVVREVGLRDGLQSIERILPTAQKIEWIRDAHAAGQREIEVGSFVPARLLPQLADTAELVAFARTLHGLFVSVLVPNLKGAARALESGAAPGPRSAPVAGGLQRREIDLDHRHRVCDALVIGSNVSSCTRRGGVSRSIAKDWVIP